MGKSKAVSGLTHTDDDILSVSSSSSGPRNDTTRVADESSQTGDEGSATPERDEVKEIEKITSKDTKSVNISRLLATAALLVTAFIVTFATYSLLKQEETNNFETAFQQFSRTLSEAALGQQQDLRDGLDQLANFITVWENSDENSDRFPFVTLPSYQAVAAGILKQAHIETVSFCPIVKGDQKDDWLDYASRKTGWVVEGHLQQMGSLERLMANKSTSYVGKMQKVTPTGFQPDEDPRDVYLPGWTYAPPPASYALVNLNMALIAPALFDSFLVLQNETLFTQVMKHPGIPVAFSYEEHARYHSKMTDSNVENPHSFFAHPVYALPGNKSSGVVGVLTGASAWDASLLGLLPEGVEDIHVVIENTCNQSFTYNIVGGDAFFLGEEDMHEAKFDDMEVSVRLDVHTHPDFYSTEGHCLYTMHIFPSTSFQQSYDTNTPEIFAAVIFGTFMFVALSFFLYDTMQQRRNTNLIQKAAQSNSIVTSLFPDFMRDRLMQQAEQKQAAKATGTLKAFLNDDSKRSLKGEDKLATPMADLYLETTVLFADVSGFTAWSSVREPTQVFILLESIFSTFDALAARRRVFKVETVGDCYVAVCGIPVPRADHALAMAKFARDMLQRMNTLTKELEVCLGPDTGDLKLRIGIHSGPVTAGVLRGERARFQLFGDTMNVCRIIEERGSPSRIHCSKETAALLTRAGKDSWLEKRVGQMDLKGKGSLETYWVTVKGDRAASVVSIDCDEHLLQTESYGSNFPGLDEKTHRLINWNVEMLLRILKQIVARRNQSFKPFSSMTSSRKAKEGSDTASSSLGGLVAETPLDEVREIIHLPEFDKRKGGKQVELSKVEIPRVVVEQLHHLVSAIASLYNDNPFHNFEHASHVVMSVTKLMSRIVAPSHLDPLASAASLHDHSYGINSDPLTQFACAFSALIHDVDHVGVSNAQLVNEGVPIAAQYRERSVAEQNSLDISWSLLMTDTYAGLRLFLFDSDADMIRFRQLVVNSVMATDIVDKDLKTLRNGRWDKAFKKGDSANHVDENPRDAVNRKATIVIEHIIQASDISHTMQHWHVYRKWNQKLYEELYVAYLNGRMDKDPAEFWYKGEFGFFDFYIIPLTQKLKDCGVFGVSSDEYLNYAKKNREEWEANGEAVVAGMIKECEAKYGVKGDSADKLQIGRRLPRGKAWSSCTGAATMPNGNRA